MGSAMGIRRAEGVGSGRGAAAAAAVRRRRWRARGAGVGSEAIREAMEDRRRRYVKVGAIDAAEGCVESLRPSANGGLAELFWQVWRGCGGEGGCRYQRGGYQETSDMSGRLYKRAKRMVVRRVKLKVKDKAA